MATCEFLPADFTENFLQALQIHRLVKTIAQRLGDEGMIRDLYRPHLMSWHITCSENCGQQVFARIRCKATGTFSAMARHRQRARHSSASD